MSGIYQQQLVHVSEAKMTYDATFGSEQALNEEFRIFVQNCQRAFERDMSSKESKILIKVPSTHIVTIE